MEFKYKLWILSFYLFFEVFIFLCEYACIGVWACSCVCACMCLAYVCIHVPLCVDLCLKYVCTCLCMHVHMHIQGQWRVFFSLSSLFRDRTTDLVLTDTARLTGQWTPASSCSASPVLCYRTHHYAWLLHSCWGPKLQCTRLHSTDWAISPALSFTFFRTILDYMYPSEEKCMDVNGCVVLFCSFIS